MFKCGSLIHIFLGVVLQSSSLLRVDWSCAQLEVPRPLLSMLYGSKATIHVHVMHVWLLREKCISIKTHPNSGREKCRKLGGEARAKGYGVYFFLWTWANSWAHIQKNRNGPPTLPYVAFSIKVTYGNVGGKQKFRLRRPFVHACTISSYKTPWAGLLSF